MVELVTPIGATMSLPSTRGQIPALMAGQVADARVLAILDSGLVRLAIAGLTVEAATTAQLTPGSTVRVLAEQQDGALKLSVVDRPQAAATPSEPSRSPIAETAVPPPLARALPGLVARQTSLAPLFADLEQVVQSSATAPKATALPAEVIAAAAKVLDFRLAATDAADPARLLTSFLTSGVFHDAAAPRAAAAMADPAGGEGGQPATPLPGQAPSQIAGSQGAANQLASGQPAGSQATGGPPGDQAGGAELAGGQGASRQIGGGQAGGLRADAPVSSAKGETGLALRSLLALVALAGSKPAGTAPASTPNPSPVPMPLPDLKSALVELRTAIVGALGQDVARLAAVIPQRSEAARPPRRGAAPRAQPAVAPLLGGDVPPREALRTLLAETEGALARLSLAQLASSDAEPAAPGRADPAASSPGWTFEVPLVADGRTSIAQIEIRRDDSRAAAAGETAPGWCVKFSIDVEPVGPVHAMLTLRGAELSVSLWAERPATAEWLKAEGGGFAALLADQDLTLDRLFVRSGRPDTPPEPVRHLVNRVT